MLLESIFKVLDVVAERGGPLDCVLYLGFPGLHLQVPGDGAAGPAGDVQLVPHSDHRRVPHPCVFTV